MKVARSQEQLKDELEMNAALNAPLLIRDVDVFALLALLAKFVCETFGKN